MLLRDMRLPELLSAFTLNVVLAVLSMVMAIMALGLLVFVLAKDSYLKEAPPIERDKLKRHESIIVDFKNPSTVPEHFLQLNTLMFQKKSKNNLVTQMPNALSLSGMETMASPKENATYERRLPLLPTEADEVASNKVSSVLRAQRSIVEDSIISSFPSSFVTDSGISEESYSSDAANSHESERWERGKESFEEGSGISERRTNEPLARKIILDFECGSNASLC